MPGRRRPPSVRARQLAAELRRLRAAAILTGDEVAGRLGWSPSKLSRIENGQSSISPGDLSLLLDTYRVSGPLLDRLSSLAGSASRRGWWDAYHDTVREGYSTLLGLESDAESELCYSPMLIPGLLQTEGYARLMGLQFDLDPGQVDRMVTVRQTQQRVLAGSDPLRFVAVLDEACLRRQVGGPAIMREQLTRLVDDARRPNVTLQVLPFSAGYHRALISGFKILHFAEHGSTDVVFMENMTSDLFIDTSQDVHQYVRAFRELQALASGTDETIDLLARAARDAGAREEADRGR